MADIDVLKEDISYRKFWLGISIAIFLSIGGWLLKSNEEGWFLIFLACIAEIGLAFVILKLNKHIVAKINSLKDK